MAEKLKGYFDKAKKEGGLAADEKVELLLLPRPQSFLEELLGGQSLDTQLSIAVVGKASPQWAHYLERAEVLALLFQHPANAILPYLIKVE